MSKKSLQKFTLQELIKLDSITEDIALSLDNETREEVRKYVQEKRNDDPTKHAELIEWSWYALSIEVRNRLYDYNHKQILKCLHDYTSDNGCIPSATEIAKETNISRQTVTKHLNELNFSPIIQEQKAKYKVMSEIVMSVVYRLALEGDIKACKLFLEQSGSITSASIQTYIDKQQNNY